MFERWRRPIRVLDHQPTDESFVTRDGRTVRGEQFVLHPDDVERMRLGYVCAKCWEPFPIPWPIRCHVCGAPVARDQRQFFENEYAGVIPLAKPFNWDEERYFLPERIAKEKEAAKKEAKKK
jgi:hypothetical protein